MRKLKTIAKQSWIGTAILTALLILLIRGWGVLQVLELSHYDLMFLMRSSIQSVARSPQIVIVGYTESDIRELQEPTLSDQTLFAILSKILNQDPALVGLDFFRESPIAYQPLKQLFQTESRLYLPARFLGSQQEQITAPDKVPLGRVGDVSVPLDRNGILRRNFLSVCSQQQLSGDCATYHPSLALQLAEAYLAPKGIRPKATEKGQLQLGEAVFQQVLPNSGGYIDVASGGGYQVLVNWRDLDKSFTTVTVSEVLKGKIDPKLFHNRIVLLGSRAPSQEDLFTTPYSRAFEAIFGVESIGFFTEQIIWSALGEKQNLKTLPEVWESLLVFIWAGIALTSLAWFYSYLKTSLLKLFLLLSVILTTLTFFISFIAFLVSWWIPFIPYAGVIFISLLGQCFILADRQRQRYLSHLERELAALQEQLEQTHQLQIAQEKSDSISFLGAKLAHDIRNVLGMLEGNLSNSLTTVREMSWLYEDDEQWEELRDSLTGMERNLNRIQDFVNSVLSYASDYEENVVTYYYLPSFLETVLAHAWEQSERKATNVALFRDYDPLLNNQTIPILPFSLERALLNLLDNSFDALLARTQWEAESPLIQVITRDRGSFIEIQIIDNGVGIDPDYQDHIFDLLFTSKSGSGTGLGLYIAYESIVKLHRGKIFLQETGEGRTCFSIGLPKQFRKEF
ncbi:MAG: CHASE2 domain-containing protein [Cyanobacteria bacterium]|jgi:CHASE2 domain-containing sensor protein/nitrogen-specific signal transduction histidine kinase|nr:CHASE2 domain-containing protein [Cyanobacteria bacterium GSL.Bin1]